MTTYKGIRGVTIPTVDGDPGTIQLGEVWYNSSAKKLRVGKTAAAAWASGGNLNTSRDQTGSAGTQTAGLTFGGNTTGGTGLPAQISDTSESYDGSAWAEGNDLTTARARIRGVGTQTAAVAIGGQKGIPAVDDAEEVESYDGTSWTEVNDLNTARYQMASFGTSTAALAVGGVVVPSTYPTEVEEWNGTSWTEIADINDSGYGMGGAGTVTAGVIAGGDARSGYASCELWNGTSWTEVNNINTGRIRLAGWGATSSTAMVAGGRSGSSPGGGWGEHDDTEEFDGTSWAEKNDLSTGRAMTQGAGVHTTGFLAGGNLGPGGPNTGITEEWVKAQNVEIIDD